MKKFALIVVTAALAMTCLAGCGAQQSNSTPVENRDTIYQRSTLQALTAGDYYGSITVEDFLKQGDIGIGTFEGVNGEMIVLDGVCYQALSTGVVEKASLSEKIPFGAITYFDSDITADFENQLDFDGLKAQLDGIVAENGTNVFYVGKIEGTFSEIKARAIDKQEEPYRPLNVVVDDSQKNFEYKDVEGTLICVYCPQYASEVNTSGWHVHFLSKDKTKGGHVFGLTMSKGSLALDRSDSLLLTLPDDEYFNKLDLTGQGDAVNKVEQGK